MNTLYASLIILCNNIIYNILLFKNSLWFTIFTRENNKYWYEYRAKKKEAKHDFKKVFSRLMNNLVSGTNIKNIRKNSDIKFVTTKIQKIIWFLEPHYHTKKQFS